MEPPMPFIVGVGRSGTTLLRLMLDAHPNVAIPSETGFIARVAGLDEEVERPTRRKRRFFNLVRRTPAWPDYRLSEDAFWEELSRIEHFTVAAGVRAFYRLYARRFGKSRYGDKTPRYAARMLLIAGLLPESRFVHLLRDGRDVALSRKGMWFEKGETFADIAANWRESVEIARSQGRSLTGRYLEIRYEDLVTDPQTELAKICVFAEIDYEDAMLRYYERAEERLGDLGDAIARDGTVRATREQRLSISKSSTRPPDAGLLYRWKRSMNAEDRREFERVAGDLLHELRYEVT
jgi:hypothetical protein